MKRRQLENATVSVSSAQQQQQQQHLVTGGRGDAAEEEIPGSHVRVTVSFYKYVPLADVAALRGKVAADWSALGVLGRIYLAAEGINAQCSLPVVNKPAFLRSVHSFFGPVKVKDAVQELLDTSFRKLKVKCRPKLVADGLDAKECDVTQCGEHLTPAQFNAKMLEQGAIVVDMRNKFETEVGHFRGAYCPDVGTYVCMHIYFWFG